MAKRGDEMSFPNVVHRSDDIDLEDLGVLEVSGKEHGLAVDIETTGLDSATASVEVVTLGVPGEVRVVTLGADYRPSRLISLLEHGSISKIFHHAVFDCSFFLARWESRVEPVFCTKVAARICGLYRNPTLAGLTSSLLGVELDKSERLSDWSSRPLSDQQLFYAASDVAYLHDLRRLLSRKLVDCGRYTLFERCMTFVPTRVELATLGLDDVYSYELPQRPT
jgi:ribonuclease D